MPTPRAFRILTATAWGIRHWRALVVASVAALAAFGGALFALGWRTRPGPVSAIAMVVGIMLAGWALLRLPAVVRLASRGPRARLGRRPGAIDVPPALRHTRPPRRRP